MSIVDKRLSQLRSFQRLPFPIRFRFSNHATIKLLCGERVRADLSHERWKLIHDRGYHELDTERFICAYLKHGDVVVDVGASCGMITAVAARRVGPAGKVYAFEPDPINYKDLGLTVALNRFSNVVTENIALSDRVGTQDFVRYKEGWGYFPAKLAESKVLDTFCFGSARQMLTKDVTNLDAYIKQHKITTLDLLKIDVDGMEIEILHGASALLSGTNPPVLIVETSQFNRTSKHSFEYIFHLLTGFGYTVWATPRMVDHFTEVQEISNMPVDVSPGSDSNANLFCYIPKVHGERWNQLWFTKPADARQPSRQSTR